MGPGDSDMLRNIRYPDPLHIHFIHVINCKIDICIIPIAYLLLFAVKNKMGVMVRQDRQEFQEDGLSVKSIGKI